MSARRLTATIVVAMTCGFCGLAGAASADAASGYGDVCALLGPPGFCAVGAFGFPAGVAVNNSAGASKGSVYVVDLTGSRVLKFNASGAPANFEATGTNELDGAGTPTGSFSTPAYIAVGPTGDIYVENAGEPVIDVFNAKGEYVPQAASAFVAPSFEGGTYAPFGVGVDQANGDVYVSDRQAGGVIDVFEADGAFLRTFPTGAGSSDSVAVNSSGDVYVDNEGTNVAEFSASGTPLGALDTVTPQAVAVNSSDGNVFVGENGNSPSYQIAEYGAPATPGEGPLAVFGGGDFASNGSYGIAVSAITHHVYVSNAAGEDGLIFEEGPEPEAPLATQATQVTGTTAILNGEVNPGASIEKAGYHFVYNQGESCAGGATSTPGETTGSHAPVSTEVTGLQPNSRYTFCLVATNTYGAVSSNEEVLITPPALPSVNDQAPYATEVALNEATLHGTINPGNGVTEYHFVYGPAVGEYTQSAPVAYAPLNYQDNAVTQLITGLEPGHVYHYALVASNATGTSTGPDQTFSTISSASPAVQTGEASGLTTTTATLTGTIDPRERPASYTFEIGASSSTYATRIYGSISPGAGPDTEVSTVIQGLTPGTTYHYRLTASNIAGTTNGTDHTFTTPQETGPLSPPAALALVPIPPFPTVETTTGTHKSTTKKHKQVKHKKTTRKKPKGHRRSKTNKPSGPDHIDGKVAR